MLTMMAQVSSLNLSRPVCTYACMRVFACACMYIRMYACMCMCACVHVCNVHVCVSMCVCVCVCMYVYMPACMNERMHAYTYNSYTFCGCPLLAHAPPHSHRRVLQYLLFSAWSWWQTMLPEACEKGGAGIGICCLCGFLAALLTSIIPL